MARLSKYILQVQQLTEIKRKCIYELVSLNMSALDKLAYIFDPRNVTEVIETPDGERYYTFSTQGKGSETGT